MDQHENLEECQIQKQLILAIATPALEMMQQDGWDGGERLELPWAIRSCAGGNGWRV
jgi:hypothetical protein